MFWPQFGPLSNIWPQFSPPDFYRDARAGQFRYPAYMSSVSGVHCASPNRFSNRSRACLAPAGIAGSPPAARFQSPTLSQKSPAAVARGSVPDAIAIRKSSISNPVNMYVLSPQLTTTKGAVIVTPNPLATDSQLSQPTKMRRRFFVQSDFRARLLLIFDEFVGIWRVNDFAHFRNAGNCLRGFSWICPAVRRKKVVSIQRVQLLSNQRFDRVGDCCTSGGNCLFSNHLYLAGAARSIRSDRWRGKS